MSWLRIDDGFPEHPKLIRLGGPSMRWTWLEVLAYCARRKTGGRVPREISEIIRRATPSFIDRCLSVGLLEVDGDALRVHDWAVYNAATLEERVAAFLEEHRDATANDVHRALGGTRKAVLAEVARLQALGGTTGGTVVPPDRYGIGTESVLSPTPRTTPTPELKSVSEGSTYVRPLDQALNGRSASTHEKILSHELEAKIDFNTLLPDEEVLY